MQNKITYFTTRRSLLFDWRTVSHVEFINQTIKWPMSWNCFVGLLTMHFCPIHFYCCALAHTKYTCIKHSSTKHPHSGCQNTISVCSCSFILEPNDKDLLGCYIKEIMNVLLLCNGENIFIRWNIEYSIQYSFASFTVNIPLFNL